MKICCDYDNAAHWRHLDLHNGLKKFRNNSSLESFAFQQDLSPELLRKSVIVSTVVHFILDSNQNFESFSSSLLTGSQRVSL